MLKLKKRPNFRDNFFTTNNFLLLDQVLKELEACWLHCRTTDKVDRNKRFTLHKIVSHHRILVHRYSIYQAMWCAIL